MSKTLAILLGLALVWLTAWSLAAYFTFTSGSEQLRTAELLRTPTTVLEPGADVRMEGTLVSAPTVKASFSERPCLAAQTNISAWSQYKDSQDHWGYDRALIKQRNVGPENLEIALGDKRVQLPLDRWVARDLTSEDVDEIPARLGVTSAEIDAAKAKLRGTFMGFTVSEATIDGGAHVFVVGKLEAGGGPLRLEADRVLGRVELFLGTQEAYVKELGRKGSSAHTVAWVFVPIGPVPLAVIGLVLLVRWRRRSALRS